MPTSAADLSSILLPEPFEPPQFDFSALFGRRGPVELEIGCGKGLFLLRESQARPATLFLGIEWSNKYSKEAAARLLNHGVANVRILRADARRQIERIPDTSLQAVHIYFPDPWWKTRHKKRRLVQVDFITQVARVLQPAGALFLATDVGEYFQVMLAVLAEVPAFERLADPNERAAEHDLDYLTHFERKYRREGRAIYRASYAKPGGIMEGTR